MLTSENRGSDSGSTQQPCRTSYRLKATSGILEGKKETYKKLGQLRLGLFHVAEKHCPSRPRSTPPRPRPTVEPALTPHFLHALQLLGFKPNSDQRRLAARDSPPINLPCVSIGAGPQARNHNRQRYSSTVQPPSRIRPPALSAADSHFGLGRA